MPDRVDHASRRPTYTVALLAISVLGGALLAHLSVPSLFASTRTQTTRLKYVLGALQDSDRPARVVALGNSVVMNGIDARLLSELAPSRAETAWNLASPGQSLILTRLLLQEIPDGTRAVIVGVTVNDLTTEAQGVQSGAYQALQMYGYRAEPDALSDCRRAASAETWLLLDTPEWRTPFEARWVARSVIDEGARRLLRRNLDLDRRDRDLYFPTPYTRRVSDRVLDHSVQRHFEPRDRCAFTPQTTGLLRSMRRVADRRGFDLLFVLMPEHPRWADYTGDGFYGDLALSLGELADLTIVDAHALLNADQFVDHLHPSQAGAALVTRRIASRLVDQRP